MKRKQMTKSAIPRKDSKNEFVKIVKEHGARKISLKISHKTPPVLVEPSSWQIKTIGNDKDGFHVNIYFEEYKNDYLDWMFYKMKSNQLNSLMVFEFFPNIKEWSESAAMEFHAREYLLSAVTTTVIVVADGTTPRTAYLFGALHKEKLLKIYSIDPLMKSCYKNDVRLNDLKISAIDCMIEDFLIKEEKSNYENLIIICPHSHVPLTNILTPLFGKYKKLSIIAMECCVEQTISQEQKLKFLLELKFDEHDFNVHSEANRIQIWSSSS